VSGKWLLAKDDLSYHFSSSRFYERGIDEFGFLKTFFSCLMVIEANGSWGHEPRRRKMV
jgi:hypothetical protein